MIEIDLKQIMSTAANNVIADLVEIPDKEQFFNVEEAAEYYAEHINDAVNIFDEHFKTTLISYVAKAITESDS